MIGVGYDADLVVLPEESHVVEADNLMMGAGWTPYQGQDLAGRPQHVIFAGQVVAAGNFVATEPRGNYQARA